MKVWNYVFITLGLIFLMEVAGIPTGNSSLLSVFGLSTTAADFSNSAFRNEIFGTAGILAVGLAAGVVISFFSKASPENYVMLPLILGVLLLFVQAFVNITQYVLSVHATWIATIVLMVMGTFGVGYMLALAEFFRGTD